MVSEATTAEPDRPAVGTPEQIRWLTGIVKTVIVLNGIDVVLTILWVKAGLAREANLLLAALLRDDPVLFVCAKLGLVYLGSWLLWRHRRRPVAVVGLFVVFLVYYALLLYHLEYASTLVRSLMR